MFLKKITILSTILFFLGASNVFAVKGYTSPADLNNAFSDVKYDTPPQAGYVTNSSANGSDINIGNSETTNLGRPKSVEEAIQMENGNSNSKSSSPQFSCEGGTNALCSEKFTINTSLFSPGGKSFVAKGGAQKTMTAFFTTLIQKLMVALGSLALLIMVFGAGFMIFAMGKDDSLNKGKTIFKAGVIALVIALSSYFMVSFLSYILYAVG